MSPETVHITFSSHTNEQNQFYLIIIDSLGITVKMLMYITLQLYCYFCDEYLAHLEIRLHNNVL